MERALRLIGDTWTLKIIHRLMSGTLRFGKLLDELGNVSPKTLSQRLKMLKNGISSSVMPTRRFLRALSIY